MLKKKLTKDTLAELSIEPTSGTPEEAMVFATQEAAKWKRVTEEISSKAD